jgi:uncharacterized protein (DUF1800 family)
MVPPGLRWNGAGRSDGGAQNIFLHPNVGPLLGNNLIQHLVTSIRSPDYVTRITGVMPNDNGSGVRGDLKAVVNAILMDQHGAEMTPRAVQRRQAEEPVLFMTNLQWAIMQRPTARI